MENNKIIERDLGILAKSSIFVFVAIFSSKLFMYLYRIIIARYYGPEIYGLFSIAFMIVGFFIIFASLGLFHGVMRFIPIYLAKKEKEKINYLINFSSKILFFSAIFSAILLYFSSEFISIKIFHNSNLIFYLKTFAFLIPIHIFSNLYFAIIRANEKIKANSFGVNILQNLIKFIFLVLFICLGLASYYSISFSYFLGIFSGLVFSYLYCRFKLPHIILKLGISNKDKENLRKEVFSYSWPLIFLGIIGTLMFWLDTFFIGYFKDIYWVGIYNSAIPIAALLFVSPEIFMQMFFPLITRELSSKNLIVVKELSKQVTKWIFILNLPLTILMLLFSGVFINIFFGQEYLLAISALRFLVIGQFIYSISIVSINMILSKGKSKIILMNLIFVAGINLSLNFILIPKYGINGAAFATFISFIILAILAIIENYYFNRIFPFRRKMLGIFLISLIPACLLFFGSRLIQVNFILLVLFGILFVVIYFGLIIFTKLFDKNDILAIKNVLKKK